MDGLKKLAASLLMAPCFCDGFKNTVLEVSACSSMAWQKSQYDRFRDTPNYLGRCICAACNYGFAEGNSTNLGDGSSLSGWGGY